MRGDFSNGTAEAIDGGDDHGVTGRSRASRPILADQSWLNRKSYSVNTRLMSTPAVPSAVSWASRCWPVVLTRA
jgi:hypothetical protein